MHFFSEVTLPSAVVQIDLLFESSIESLFAQLQTGKSTVSLIKVQPSRLNGSLT